MHVGLFGKLPSHGDFLRRRTSDEFVDAWDAWLRECLAESRTALGDRWLDIYLTSPAWRFVCAAGACGPVPVIGLMVPSVDRVGRFFPLTLVAELPDDVSVVAAANGATGVLRQRGAAADRDARLRGDRFPAVRRGSAAPGRCPRAADRSAAGPARSGRRRGRRRRGDRRGRFRSGRRRRSRRSSSSCSRNGSRRCTSRW